MDRIIFIIKRPTQQEVDNFNKNRKHRDIIYSKSECYSVEVDIGGKKLSIITTIHSRFGSIIDYIKGELNLI